MSTDKEIAATILAQLGGNRFTTMTGASSLTSGDSTLSFRLPRTLTKHGIMGMRIKLMPNDTYTLTALRLVTRPITRVDEVDVRDGVYCDNLREIFEDMTGLATSL